ncbi:non-ribosomal peptide synthetase [Nocardia fluminea]|uniref:Amino acid adenylation domain-containing protein/thioester reductase-like protein n=1 Tax=Nocardia fluminea TaxID=134984 RepID=A0A2N3V9H0_9NOCA|nr:non-ribosomal peptide synthetase [Nocardia fluminea]PKV78264.1 amino acid adenylation domain-containing protein/thioester reductase-like protein [Nocardia fluminea]
MANSPNDLTGVFELSPTQLGLWYTQHMDPLVPINIAKYVDIRGDIDIPTLNAAIIRAADELGTGRVRIVTVNGDPGQIVDPAVEVTPAVIDLRSAVDPEAAAAAWMRADYTSPVDLLNSQLLQMTVLRLSDDRWFWYLRAHHIVMDGFGAMVGIQRVAQLYTDALRGVTTPPLDAPSIRNVSDYEIAYRASPRYERDRRYWTARMKGLRQRSSLVRRSAAPAPENTLTRAEFSSAQRGLLSDAATRLDTTPATVLIAAFATYVAGWMETDEVTLSLPVAARLTAATRHSCGSTANVVPLRLRLGEDTTCAEFSRAVQLEVSGALRHQRYWHNTIRRDVASETDGLRDDGTTEFFGPWVNIMAYNDEITLGPVCGRVKVLTTGAIEDLALNFVRAGDNCQLDLETNPDLYSPTSAQAHHGRFLDFLTRFLAAEPTTRLRTLEIATADECARAMDNGAGPVSAVPEYVLADLLDSGTPGTPDRIALQSAEGVLTSAEFAAKVNQLARYLIERRVGSETIVALHLRRSHDLVIAIHAVIRAGGAFLPIDPHHPTAHNAAVLAGSGADHVLTTLRDSEQLPDTTTTVSNLDQLDLSSYPASPVTVTDRLRPVRPDNLAYLLYTSGSTGTPKGVAVDQRAIVNQLLWMRDEYRIGPDDVYLQKTASTFDVSLWGYLLPLMAGARLVLADHDNYLDPEYLAHLVHQHRVTVTDFAPTMLAPFVAEADRERCVSLRAVFVIGEALPPETAAGFRAISAAGLHNLYGPTEAAISVTHHRTTPDDGRTVPIGVPERNVVLRVLDARLRPVPTGASGELYLCGIQLARGYLGRTDLTAERFVADPFRPGSRMYRTGDLAAWTADGHLEYLGRTDSQVKFRGQRIELGEIESRLLAGDSVAQAVVLVSTTGDLQQLAAFVVPKVGTAPVANQLRTELFATLPSPMVPGIVAVLPKMPTTPSGKVDRRALASQIPALKVSVQRPQTPTEQLVAGMFAEALGVDEVGRDQDFYALGGNSLLAFQVRSNLMARTGSELPLRDFFRTPSVSSLAALIDGRSTAATAELVEADLHLLDTLAHIQSEATTHRGHILLTGATGFLGAHLLSELIEQTDATIWCLVRARSDDAAAAQITASLLRFGLWSPRIRDRIIALPADLAESGLGLEAAVFDMLSSRITTIVHCGAHVSHLDEYERVRAANVDGTRELLRMAGSGSRTSLHYISTTSMFSKVENAAGSQIREQDRPAFTDVEYSGYVTSKWVAESLVESASEQGISTSIYRVSLISGHTRTGAGAAQGFWNMVRAIAVLGVAPSAAMNTGIELVPVDYAAESITRIATGTQPGGLTFHIVNNRHVPVRTILDSLRSRGHRITEVSADEFRTRLRNEASARASVGDFSLAGAALLSESGEWAARRAMTFDDSNTRSALAGTGTHRPSVDSAVLERYLAYFERTGYIPDSSARHKVPAMAAASSQEQ